MYTYMYAYVHVHIYVGVIDDIALQAIDWGAYTVIITLLSLVLWNCWFCQSLCCEADNLLPQRQRTQGSGRPRPGAHPLCALSLPVEDPSAQENPKSLGRKGIWSTALFGADYYIIMLQGLPSEKFLQALRD